MLCVNYNANVHALLVEMCAALVEVLSKIIGEKMDIAQAEDSGRMYDDVRTDTIRYDGSYHQFIVVHCIFIALNCETSHIHVSVSL